jgi:hypothetical protein
LSLVKRGHRDKTTEREMAHQLQVPPRNWDELLNLEPGLRVVAELIPMLGKERDDGRVYFALKHVIRQIVGWRRGTIEDGVCYCDDPGGSAPGGVAHATFSNLMSAPMPIKSDPQFDAERWLRSPEAYDMAMRYMMGRIGA